MNTVIRVHDYGGPDVLRTETLPVPTPAAGEIVLRHDAIGVNFIDTYFRSGLYKFPSLPAIPGMEARAPSRRSAPTCRISAPACV